MFQDYVDRIKEKYYEMQTSTSSKPRLAQPTLARLREECVDAFIARFERKDENTLRVFFRHTGDIKALGKIIQGFDLNKFKPLLYFLNGKNKNTDQKNIELLAWLLDYDRRPFELGENYDQDRENIIGTGNKQKGGNEKATEADLGKNLVNSSPMEKPTSQTKNIYVGRRRVIIITTILLLAFIVYKWGFKKYSKNRSADSGGCMYWTGDHYEPISCKPRSGDTLVIPFDTRLQNFRRITTPDTITVKSIEKLWYLKRNGSPEFYTSDGFHPAELRRQLKPLTSYIFEKYLK